MQRDTCFKYGAARLAIAWFSVASLCSCTSTQPDQSTSNNTQKTASTGSAKATIRVAANLPMSGPLAIYGQCVRDGATMAVDDLKSNPASPTIEIDWQDNAGEARNTVSIMQKQFMNAPDIYMSGVKPQTMAIKDQVTSRGTPHWVWIFDSYVNRDNKVKNNFRTYLNFKVEPPVMLDYVKKMKPKKIAILYVRLPSTEEEYENVIVPGLRQLGIKDIMVEPYDISTKDFKSYAVKVQQFKPDLTILSAFQDGYVGIVRAFRPLGLIKEGNVLTSYDLIDAAKILGKDELEGLRLTAPSFMLRQDEPEIKAWVSRFRDRYKREPLYTDFYAYDAVNMIADTSKRVQADRSVKSWCDSLITTRLPGITGPLAFDDDNSLKIQIEVARYDRGKLVPAK